MIRVITLATLLFAGFTPAWGQSFPTKPIHMIVGISPGSANDIAARLVSIQMGKGLGQSFIVENRVGASGTIAAKYVASAPPDGYILFFGSVISISPFFVKENGLDAPKEFSPVSNSFALPFVFYTTGKKPFKSLQDVVAFARANPDKTNYGTTTFIVDMVMGVLKSRTGISYTTISYKGAPELIAALSSGEVDFTFGSPSAYTGPVKSGAVRALFSTRPSSQFPNLPTAADAGIANFEALSNLGVWAPVGLAQNLTSLLSAHAAQAARSPEIAEQVRNSVGGEAVGSAAEDQMRTYEADVRFWREAMRLANFQPQ